VSADDIRRELLSAASGRRTITYGQLMQRFALTRGDAGKSVVGILGEIDRGEASKGAPGFAAIVVRKDTGYPGGGFFCWDDGPVELRRPTERCQDPKLSPAEKAYVRKLQEKIWGYYGADSRD
jgi:hypothetical protein